MSTVCTGLAQGPRKIGCTRPWPAAGGSSPIGTTPAALESGVSSVHARSILLLMWLGAFAESLRASVPAVGLGTTTAHRWTLVHQIYGSKSSPSWMSKCDSEFMPKPWSEGAGLGMVKHHGAHPEDHLEDHPRHLGETHGWKSRFCETSGTTQEEEGDSEPKIVELGNAGGASRMMRSTSCTQKWRPPRPHLSPKRMTARLSDEGDRKYRRIPNNRKVFLEVRQNHPDRGKHPGYPDHSRFEQCGDSNSPRQHAGCSV